MNTVFEFAFISLYLSISSPQKICLIFFFVLLNKVYKDTKSNFLSLTLDDRINDQWDILVNITMQTYFIGIFI